jgi:hypothetical protein
MKKNRQKANPKSGVSAISPLAQSLKSILSNGEVRYQKLLTARKRPGNIGQGREKSVGGLLRQRF